MSTMTTKELDSTYLAHTYKRFPVEIVSGQGSVLTDETGKTYIDMGSGIAVNIFGVNDAAWKAAVTAQLDLFQHTSNLYYSAPAPKLAQLLCQKTGMKKVFFSNSGAEANECAVKVARKWAQLHKGDDYYTIITLWDSFHGRTLTTLAATGQDHYHEEYQPLTPGFVHAHAGDLEELEELLKTHKCAAILFEAIQGEGGVAALNKDYVQGMAALAEQYDVLLMADEVQAGNGRSGWLYAYMAYGVTPDVVTTAKGIGGGLPLGCCMMGEMTADVLTYGLHGSTYGGNPVACAAGLNVVSRIDDALLAGVKERSAYIISQLTGAPGVKSISGMGLMLGVEPENKKAADVAAACIENGVLVLTAGKNKVRLLPALNIPMEQLQAAVAVLKAAFAG